MQESDAFDLDELFARPFQAETGERDVQNSRSDQQQHSDHMTMLRRVLDSVLSLRQHAQTNADQELDDQTLLGLTTSILNEMADDNQEHHTLGDFETSVSQRMAEFCLIAPTPTQSPNDDTSDNTNEATREPGRRSEVAEEPITKKRRKGYKCGLCGKLRKGHVCDFVMFPRSLLETVRDNLPEDKRELIDIYRGGNRQSQDGGTLASAEHSSSAEVDNHESSSFSSASTGMAQEVAVDTDEEDEDEVSEEVCIQTRVSRGVF
jgi:hypothetical protein